VATASLDIWFRAPAGQQPDVPEIGMHGNRHRRVEACWDGCLFPGESRSLGKIPGPASARP
jgi:hypothetical protein